jgi:hypothetical protein
MFSCCVTLIRLAVDGAGVLLVDAEGHGIISAKIAFTVHDTFHSLMLSELDRWVKQRPGYLKGSTYDWHNRSALAMRWGEVKETTRERSRPCFMAKCILPANFGS